MTRKTGESIRRPDSEARRSKVRLVGIYKRSEVGDQRSEVRGRRLFYLDDFLIRKGPGLFIMEPNIFPISMVSFTSSSCFWVFMKPQLNAKSNNVSVSLFSPSESVNLFIKCASYRLLARLHEG